MSEPIISRELNDLESSVESILSNNPTVHNEILEITEDYALYENCVFNQPVKVTGKYARMNNCIFNGSSTLIVGINSATNNAEGRGAQINNCIFEYADIGQGTEENGYHRVSIYASAMDTCFSNFWIRGHAQYSGIMYSSYGGSFQNFTISQCMQYGMRIHAGGAQIQNGKIFMCGNRSNLNGGGLFIYPSTTYADYEYIPEINAVGLSIQQCFGFGLKMKNVLNSHIEAVVLGNNAGILENGDPDGNGVYDTLYHNYRQYGVQLIDCKDVSGTINGCSCHEHFKSADLGYYDDIPSRNSINVVWSPVYYDGGNSEWKTAFKKFAKFLPEVHAETVNNVKINGQYTEANFSDTSALTSANTYVVGADGLPDTDDTHCKIIKLQNTDNVPISNKGIFRVYVEAPGFNIYTFVKVVGTDGSTWVQNDNTTGSTEEDLHRYYSSGQHSVHSSVVPYDASSKVLDGVAIKRVELRLVFNSIEALEANTSVTPKVRVQHFSY